MNAADEEKVDEDDVDVNVLRFAAELLSYESIRDRGRKRGEHDVLKALVIGEEMKHCIGVDADEITRAAREIRPDFKRHQAKNYLRGRFTPPHDLIVLISQKKAVPELRKVAEWPWALLTTTVLNLGEIEEICAPAYKTLFSMTNGQSPSFNRRNRSRWHDHQNFRPCENWLDPPGDPEAFWRHLAHFRAAAVLKDFHSTNAHYWNTIKSLSSIARHRAVIPHVERLFTCVRILLLDFDAQILWFSSDWNAIRRGLEYEIYGPSSLHKPFSNIFTGNFPHVGRDYPLTKLHRQIDAMQRP